MHAVSRSRGDYGIYKHTSEESRLQDVSEAGGTDCAFLEELGAETCQGHAGAVLVEGTDRHRPGFGAALLASETRTEREACWARGQTGRPTAPRSSRFPCRGSLWRLLLMKVTIWWPFVKIALVASWKMDYESRIRCTECRQLSQCGCLRCWCRGL